jgi:3',5'-cyclic AMP phosphodiesterase CpdA
MLFLHLTDLHLVQSDLKNCNFLSDTVMNLNKMVDFIQAMGPPPDFVILSGDLTNQGDVASYELLRDTLAPLAMPLLFALGNHDDRHAFHQVFPEVCPNSAPDAPVCHVSCHGALQVVILDSLVPGQTSGALAAHQLEFLQATLAKNPDQATLLVLHHPPFMAGQAAYLWESMNRQDSEKLAKILAKHNIVGMLCGHVHHNRLVQWHGIPVIVNNGLHNFIDVTVTDALAIKDSTGFGLCKYHDYGLSVTFLPLTPEQPITKTLPKALVEKFR